jgi:hypothetical protein
MTETERNRGASDRLRLSVSEKAFWTALWELAPFSMWDECGLDMVRFGPIWAACMADDPGELGFNLILGSSEAGAVEHGHLANAAAWLEARPLPAWGRVDEGFGVDYRVPVIPGLPGSASAERWLEEHGAVRGPGPAKFVRDTSPPRVASPAGIEVLDWNDWDDWFPEHLAESLRLPSRGTSLFTGLMTESDETWRSYGAVGSEEPLAYAAMHLDSGVATLVFASRPSELREGAGQVALLNRFIQAAAAAGCDMIVVTDAGHGPAVIDRECLERVGFEVAFQAPAWRSRVEVEA